MTSFISKLSAICVENNIINEADVQISPERCEDFASGGVRISV